MNSNLVRGESKSRSRSGVMVGKWRDKRDVHFISTEFQSDVTEYVTKGGETKIKPLSILKYNEFMSGIDKQDQMMAYYPCSRKVLRWYKKLGIYFFQLILLNFVIQQNVWNEDIILQY